MSDTFQLVNLTLGDVVVGTQVTLRTGGSVYQTIPGPSDFLWVTFPGSSLKYKLDFQPYIAADPSLVSKSVTPLQVVTNSGMWQGMGFRYGLLPITSREKRIMQDQTRTVASYAGFQAISQIMALNKGGGVNNTWDSITDRTLAIVPIDPSFTTINKMVNDNKQTFFGTIGLCVLYDNCTEVVGPNTTGEVGLTFGQAFTSKRYVPPENTQHVSLTLKGIVAPGNQIEPTTSGFEVYMPTSEDLRGQYLHAIFTYDTYGQCTMSLLGYTYPSSQVLAQTTALSPSSLGPYTKGKCPLMYILTTCVLLILLLVIIGMGLHFGGVGRRGIES
jgi:hypothetical protein